MKMRSLGTVQTAGQVPFPIFAEDGGTPIQISFATAEHFKNGDRIHLATTPLDSACYGEWTLENVGIGVATLRGSKGTATFTSDFEVSILCDEKPFLPGTSCMALLADFQTASPFQGTVIIEKGSTLNPTTGAVSDFADAKKGLALPADPGELYLEIDLERYMRLRCIARTAGGIRASMFA